jgi:hypothetical protein
MRITTTTTARLAGALAERVREHGRATRRDMLAAGFSAEEIDRHGDAALTLAARRVGAYGGTCAMEA